jgi:PmbA protein
MLNLEELGRKVLQRAHRKGGLETEVFVSSNVHTAVSVRDQKIEEVKKSEDLGLSIRVIGKDKMGFAYTGDVSDAGIGACIEHAYENHDHNAIDPNWALADIGTYPDPAELKIYDTALEKVPLEDKIARAMQIEKSAQAFDRRIRKTEHASWSDSLSEVFLCNSRGLCDGYRSTSCGGMADVIAEDGQTMESGSGMWFGVDLAGFDPAKIGRDAGEQACALLGAKAPATAKTDIVFTPEVGISFLAVLAELFLASSVQKGRSLLLNKLGTQIASSNVTLTDDGLLPGQLGTAPYDGEGTPCQRTPLIENGKLKNYLYSIYTANKEKKHSTGNAQRGTFSLPEIQPSNFYIEPGTKDQTQIIKAIRSGILIIKVMGMHTADPVSGDFSIGIAGRLIKNGALGEPIRGGAIAGNLLDLLRLIHEVGNDLFFLPFHGNIGCPTLHIKDISVSGR